VDIKVEDMKIGSFIADFNIEQCERAKCWSEYGVHNISALANRFVHARVCSRVMHSPTAMFFKALGPQAWQRTATTKQTFSDSWTPILGKQT